ncbi:hypothetical protein M9194_01150 [Vibrio sp. S4M6]|uniref:hypothetical protein n=1 Tax=Vibrio sinus TaxID=2946865 RepID=UPI00202A2728|nr:hypothetical protein [Vibrio sinus]MCL9780036.1 hypothetical protein [Vibrio sinus]
MQQNVFIVLVMALFVSGCTTTKVYKPVDSPLIGAQFVGAPVLNSTNSGAIPAWAVTHPDADGQGVYGVGTGVALNLDTAISKAKLSARTNLADSLMIKLYGKPSKDTQKTQDESREERTRIIRDVIAQVPDNVFSMAEQQVLMRNSQFTAYSLVKLSYVDFYSYLSQQMRISSSDELKSVFQELKEKIKKMIERRS